MHKFVAFSTILYKLIKWMNEWTTDGLVQQLVHNVAADHDEGLSTRHDSKAKEDGELKASCGETAVGDVDSNCCLQEGEWILKAVQQLIETRSIKHQVEAERSASIGTAKNTRPNESGFVHFHAWFFQGVSSTFFAAFLVVWECFSRSELPVLKMHFWGYYTLMSVTHDWLSF